MRRSDQLTRTSATDGSCLWIATMHTARRASAIQVVRSSACHAQQLRLAGHGDDACRMGPVAD